MLALQPQDEVAFVSHVDYTETSNAALYIDLDAETVLCLPQVEAEFSIIGPDALLDLADNIEQETILEPVKIDDGCGGVYLLGANDSRVVFKPRDEEVESTGQVGYVKEFAAYLIDDGMARVPHTGIACLPWIGKDGYSLKVGSLQQFVPETESAADLGPALFNQDDVHRIGVLDLRIVNCDRHSGNMLFSNETKNLVPIDHGLSFPNAFTDLGKASFDWLLYPSAKKPFSEQMLKEIEAIDVQKDMLILESLGIGFESQLSLWMSTTILQIGAKSGKTLYEIGCMVQRQGDRSQPSVLETLFVKALHIVKLYKVNFWSVFVECIYSYLNVL